MLYAPETFTDEEAATLRPYFTNLDGPVFALTNLPEVVKGALFARYSRSDKSLRRLFLDEFVGDLDLTGDLTVDATVGLRRAEELYARVFFDYGELPNGFGYEWTGQSLQEIQSGSQAPALIALSILFVFLLLSALYESWSIPLSVMLVVPLGVIGSVLAVTWRGMPNDVYFLVGLITRRYESTMYVIVWNV